MPSGPVESNHKRPNTSKEPKELLWYRIRQKDVNEHLAQEEFHELERNLCRKTLKALKKKRNKTYLSQSYSEVWIEPEEEEEEEQETKKISLLNPLDEDTTMAKVFSVVASAGSKVSKVATTAAGQIQTAGEEMKHYVDEVSGREKKKKKKGLSFILDREVTRSAFAEKCDSEHDNLKDQLDWWLDGTYGAQAFRDHSLQPLHRQVPSRMHPLATCLSEDLQVSGFTDGRVRVWHWNDKSEVVLHAHTSPVRVVASEQNEEETVRRVFSGSDTGMVVLWQQVRDDSESARPWEEVWKTNLPFFQGACIVHEKSGRVGSVISNKEARTSLISNAGGLGPSGLATTLRPPPSPHAGFKPSLNSLRSEGGSTWHIEGKGHVFWRGFNNIPGGKASVGSEGSYGDTGDEAEDMTEFNEDSVEHLMAMSSSVFCKLGIALGTHNGIVIILDREYGEITIRCTLPCASPAVPLEWSSAELWDAEKALEEPLPEEWLLEELSHGNFSHRIMERPIPCLAESQNLEVEGVEMMLIAGTHDSRVWVLMFDEGSWLLPRYVQCLVLPKPSVSMSPTRASGRNKPGSMRMDPGVTAVAGSGSLVFAAIDCCIWAWTCTPGNKLNSATFRLGPQAHPVTCLALSIVSDKHPSDDPDDGTEQALGTMMKVYNTKNQNKFNASSMMASSMMQKWRNKSLANDKSMLLASGNEGGELKCWRKKIDQGQGQGQGPIGDYKEQSVSACSKGPIMCVCFGGNDFDEVDLEMNLKLLSLNHLHGEPSVQTSSIPTGVSDSVGTHPKSKDLQNEMNKGAIQSVLKGAIQSDGALWVTRNHQFLITSVKDPRSKKRDVVVYDFHRDKRFREQCQILAELHGHEDFISSMCMMHADWNDGGNWLFSGSFDTTIRCWDLAKRVLPDGAKETQIDHIAEKEDIILKNEARVYCLAVGRDPEAGKTLFAGLENGSVNVWLWQDHQNRPIDKFNVGGRVQSVSTSRSSSVIVGSANNTVTVWEKRKMKFTLSHVLSEHDGNVNAVFLGYKTQNFVSGSSDCMLFLWSLQQLDVLNGHDPEPTQIFMGHKQEITSVVLSQNSQFIFSGDKSGKICSWDVVSGVCDERVQVHHAEITAIHLVEELNEENKELERLLVSVCKHGSLRITRYTNAKQNVQKRHTMSVSDVSISPDGKFGLSSSLDGTIRRWDLKEQTLQRTFFGHTAAVLSIDLSPDAKYFVSASTDFSIRVWEIATGKSVCSQETDPSKSCNIQEEGHSDRVTTVSMAVRANGDFVIASGGVDHRVCIWELSKNWQTTGSQLTEIARKQDNSNVASVAFSSDTEWVAYGSADGQLMLWVPSMQSFVTSQMEHEKSTRHEKSTPKSRDSKKVVPWAEKTNGHESSITDLAHDLKFHSRSVNSVCFSTDRQVLLAGSSDKMVSMWLLGKKVTDTRLLKVLPHDRKVFSVKCAMDHSLEHSSIFVCTSSKKTGGELLVWDTCCAAVERRYPCHKSGMRCLGVSHDGHHVLTGGHHGDLLYWDLWFGSEDQILQKHNEGVLCCDISSDGQKIVSGGKDNLIVVWNAFSGKPDMLLHGHVANVSTVDLSTDNTKLLSGSWDATLFFWDLKSGRISFVLQGHTSAIEQAQITDDNTKAVSASRGGKVIWWDLIEGKRLSLVDLDAPIRCLCLTQTNHPQRAVLGCESKDVPIRWFTSPHGERKKDDQKDNEMGELPSLQNHHKSKIRFVALRRNDEIMISAGQSGDIVEWSCSLSADKIRCSAIRVMNDTDFFPAWYVYKGIVSMAIDENARFMMVSNGSNETSLWDFRDSHFHGNEPLVLWRDHKKRVPAVCLTPNAKVAISCSFDKTLAVHKISESGKPISSSLWYNWPCLTDASKHDDGRYESGELLRRLLQSRPECLFEKLQPLGWTLLHWLARQGNLSAINVVLELAGDKPIAISKDIFRETPLDSARRGKRADLADRMMAHFTNWPKHSMEFLSAVVASLFPMNLASMPEFLDSRLQEPLPYQMLPIPDHAEPNMTHAVLTSTFTGLTQTKIYAQQSIWERIWGSSKKSHHDLLPVSVSCIYLRNFTRPDHQLMKNLTKTANDQVFLSKVVQIILLQKWNTFGLNSHIQSSGIFFLQLFFFTNMCFNMNGGCKADFAVEDLGKWICEPGVWGWCAAATAVYFFICEIKQIISDGSEKYLNDIWNWIDVLANAGVIFSVALQAPSVSSTLLQNELHWLPAFTTLLLWLQFLFFMRGFRGTGALVRMIVEIGYDIRYFLLIMFLMTMAFSLANYTMHPDRYLEADETGAWEDHTSVSYFMWHVYIANWVGDFDGADYAHSRADVILFLCQSVFIFVVMLNLLIALMGDTFARVKARSEIAYFRELAHVLCEIEGGLPLTEHQNQTRFPKYLLSVRPRQNDWRRQGTDPVDKLQTLEGLFRKFGEKLEGNEKRIIDVDTKFMSLLNQAAMSKDGSREARNASKDTDPGNDELC